MELDEQELEATRNRNKSADELLKELGYKKKEIINKIIYEDGKCRIIIDNDFEIIDIIDHYITKTELQAIKKKVEELGWK